MKDQTNTSPVPATEQQPPSRERLFEALDWLFSLPAPTQPIQSDEGAS